MSIVTKNGDSGQTSLATGERVPKSDRRVAAMAALDELNAQLGVVKPLLNDPESVTTLETVQRTLMEVLTLAASSGAYGHTAEPFSRQLKWLEQQLAACECVLPPQRGFILYGASPVSAALQLARAIARRAEAAFAEAFYPFEDNLRIAAAYLNRLSDFLYLWAQYADYVRDIARAVQKAGGFAEPNAASVDSRFMTQSIAPVGGSFTAPSDLPLDASRSAEKSARAFEATDCLTLEIAQRVAHRIEQRAYALCLPVSVVFCDVQGSPLLLHVMDGALPVSREAAAAKAYTAAVLRMDTDALRELVQPGGMFYTLEALGSGKITAIAGGVTLHARDGAVIGGLGVSGGSAAQDAELAEYGRSLL